MSKNLLRSKGEAVTFGEIKGADTFLEIFIRHFSAFFSWCLIRICLKLSSPIFTVFSYMPRFFALRRSGTVTLITVKITIQSLLLGMENLTF